MKPSVVAKELGYTVAEMVWFARVKGIELESTQAEISARTVALIRAQLPTKKTLKSEPELLDKIKAGGDEVKASEGKSRPKAPARRSPQGEGGAPKPKKLPAPPKPAFEKPKPPPPPPAKPVVPPPPPPAKPVTKRAVVKEIKLAPPKPVAAPPKVRKLTPEEEERVRAEEAARRAHKPLIELKEKGDGFRTVRADEPRSDTNVDRTARRDDRGRGAAKGPRKQPRPPRAILEAMKPRKPARPASEREMSVTVPISIKDLSQEIGIKSGQIIRKLMEHGMMATINTALDKDAVEMMALEFNRKVKIKEREVLAEQVLITHKDAPGDLKPRPPVVTILGHVDHGKTSLLDRIRQTNVAAGEAGGITQSIAAYRVTTPGGKGVVFIDTPGHEAFTAMRARGANITDVVVLVIAADDGVMPQTEESMNHARAAGVPIVVAVNKIDKPEANIQKVKQQIAQKGLNPEEWGGDTVVCEVSALTGKGVPEFLELLALQADLLELKANPDREADGRVLEVEKSDSRGIVATVLVQGGTLRKGDIVICGSTYGRVRAMLDDRDREIAEAPPATPVRFTGLEDLPEVGCPWSVVKDIKDARRLAEERKGQKRDAGLGERQRVTLENIFDRIESGKAKELNVVLKTDVTGSLEVLSSTLQALSTKELKLKLIHAGVGSVNGSDVDLAVASDAVIICFNVGAETRAAAQAEDQGIQIRRHTVIYTLIEEVQASLEGLLEPEEVETVLGTLRVKEVFKTSKGSIAGSIVTQGKVERSARVRVMRGGQKLHTGKIASLRRFKDDVREVAEGFECGLKLEGFEDVRKDDLIEAFTIEKVPRKVYQRQ